MHLFETFVVYWLAFFVSSLLAEYCTLRIAGLGHEQSHPFSPLLSLLLSSAPALWFAL